jgi:heavy metal translocating P-type ATPase
MDPGFQVFLHGRSRACITGAGKESADAAAIATWLAAQSDVVRFEQRPTTGAFYVDFNDGDALRGHFLRALRDRLEILKRPEPFDVKPVHSLPGRVRVRITGIRPEQLAMLTLIVGRLPGVTQTKHISGSNTTLIGYDTNSLSEDRILDFLRKCEPSDWAGKGQRPIKLRWGNALSCTSTVLFCFFGGAPFSLKAFWIVLNTLRPLLRSIEALGEGKISIDLLDVAATFAALATERPVTAAFVVWMVGVGDLLLDLSANEARSAMAALVSQNEQEAYRLRKDGSIERVPVQRLKRGDHFVVYTGHGIVADGKVFSGSAEVDEKALTGESRLISKKAGDSVLASTVVAEGQIVVAVESFGRDTEAAKIESVLETVGSKPPTLQRNALEFASKLVLPTFGVAGLAAALSGDVTRAVCILITDFGTGIRIAVPVSAMTAMTLAAREGVLVKGAQYLERLSKTDVIIFDKTGTLTNGAPEVVEVVTNNGFSKSSLIELSASAESKSEHPVARALTSYARLKHIELVEPEVGSEEYVVGLGLSARVKGHRVRVGRASWMKSQDLKTKAFKSDLARLKADQISTLCVAVGHKVVGLIGYSDGTRPEAARMVEKLRAGGKRSVVLLSGDNPEVVKNVAREVGIDEAVGGLLPHEKADYVRRMQAAGHVVAMVGDGVNDAPALAAADVGISIVGSTAVAMETADVILLEGGLVRLEKAFRISDQAMTKVRQNLGMIIAPNAFAIGLGALGLISPLVAAIINNGATIFAVLFGTAPLLFGPSPASKGKELGHDVSTEKGRIRSRRDQADRESSDREGALSPSCGG